VTFQDVTDKKSDVRGELSSSTIFKEPTWTEVFMFLLAT